VVVREENVRWHGYSRVMITAVKVVVGKVFWFSWL
jgi:hypothetical protein